MSTPNAPVVAVFDPATFVLTDVKSWTPEETKARFKNQDVVNRFYELQKERSQPKETPEEIAAREDAEAAAAIEKARIETEAAEKAKAEAKAKADADAAAAPKTKIVVKYQAKDEKGQPIGTPTYLEADTWEEMSEKQTQAHVNAVRAYSKLKKQKENLTFKQEPKLSGPTQEELAEAARDLNSDDLVKKTAAVRKIAGSDEIQKQKEANDAEAARLRGVAIGLEFRTKHYNDFNPCEANSRLIGDYLQTNNLEFTLDNLEVALAAVEDQLTPVESQVPAVQVPAAAANTPPVAPAPANAEPAAPVVPPAAAPIQTPAPAVTPPKRTGDLQPGAQSGRRPEVKPAGLTKADIAKMDRVEYKRRMKIPHLRAEIEKALASK